MEKVNTANQIDVYIGKRLRERRTLLGMSQTAVGNKLNLTFQQIQKYEHGANRIGGSRLWQLCGMLDVEPNYFFDGLKQRQAAYGEADPNIMDKRETLELVKNYYLIGPGHLRKMAYNVVATLAGTE